MIESFVEAYNELQGLMAQQTSYNSDTGASGALQGDALTRSIQGQLRSLMSNGNLDAGISSLAELGITTSRTGQLEIDSSTLNDVLSNNFDQVAEFFSAEETGLANQLDSMLETYLQSNGTFDARTDSINRQMDDIDDQRESLSMRLDKLEARLFAQFNAMDAIVAQLNSTGEYLTQQLASIAQIGKSNND
jgi:flagellar hook-associated protein 2